MTDKIDFTPNYGPRQNSSIIKVIGVGGGGSNAVEHMYEEGIVGVDFLVCNTDKGHLERSPIPSKLLLGEGLGAGANPEIARQYAVEGKEKIKEFIGTETQMLFITAGMGKGTGTGASPVIAQVAREMGILTVGVVTSPFTFEGRSAVRQANQGITELSKSVDSLIVVKNQNIIKYYQDEDIDKAFGYANDVLKSAVKCIAELITVNYIQNVDFNDVKSIMKDSSKAMLGLATASGEGRANRVVDDALACPLLDNPIIQNAHNFLFFLSYGPEGRLTTTELETITERFYDLTSDDAKVIWGRGEDPSLGDKIKLSIIVTNFNDAQSQVKNVIVEQEPIHNDNPCEETDEIQITVTEREDDSITDNYNTPSTPQYFDNSLPNDMSELMGNQPNAVQQPQYQDVNRPAATYEFDVQDNGLSKSAEINLTMGTLERQQDTLFPTDDDFQRMQEIPAFQRQMKMQKSMSPQPAFVGVAEEYHSRFEHNKMSEFFGDITD